MHNPSPSAPLSWPELPDEAAVALQGVLHDFVMLFEAHYLGQIERYYHERSREHLVATRLRPARPVPLGLPGRSTVLNRPQAQTPPLSITGRRFHSTACLTIKAEQSLITVESDKASMEIPSSHAGVVKELKVKLGDKVAEGSVVLLLEASGAASAAPAAPAAPVSEQKKPNPGVSCVTRLLSMLKHLRRRLRASFGGAADLECDVLVLGGGPGGYSAAFRAADLGLKVVMVERYATLGGVCLNVGCIPSKALLHVAAVMDEVSHLGDLGVDFGVPVVNIDKLRGHKEKVISKLTGGLGAMAKMRKVTTVRGYGHFVGTNHVEVEETTGTGQEKTGTKKVVAFKRAIIAAGSQAVRLPFMPNDPRVVDSTGALGASRKCPSAC
jgi:dihydrolipoamide dehydrogenase